jgi:hypothetical protein
MRGPNHRKAMPVQFRQPKRAKYWHLSQLALLLASARNAVLSGVGIANVAELILRCALLGTALTVLTVGGYWTSL